MMTSETKDSAVLFYYEWEESFEELSDSEYRQMIQAIQKYAKTGELPKFEDRTMRSVFKLVRKAIDRNTERYDKKCQKNKENGRLGGAPKGNQNAKRKTTETTQNNRTVEKTTETTLRERERERERVPERDPEPERGRGGVEPAEPDTTTTTQLQEAIVEIWNSHDFVQKIKRVDSPQKRWERTEMAIAVAGGKKEFLHQLQTLDEHAYLRNQPDQGYKVIYDWLTAPENFQSFLEGRYKDARGDAKKYEGWEVVEFG